MEFLTASARGYRAFMRFNYYSLKEGSDCDA
jgi:hypothetical protein